MLRVSLAVFLSMIGATQALRPHHSAPAESVAQAGPVTVVFSGHVAVLHPKPKTPGQPVEGTVAALAATSHATQIAIVASGLSSWDPNGSGLVLRGGTLPGGDGGRAAFLIDIPASGRWDIQITDGQSLPRVTDNLGKTVNPALRLRTLRTEMPEGSKVDTEEDSPSARARVRLLMSAVDAELADYSVTQEFYNQKIFYCEPAGNTCQAGTAANQQAFTDRFRWTTQNPVVVKWKAIGGGFAPRLGLKGGAEIWLINSAVEAGSFQPAATYTLEHLRHFYDWATKPDYGTRFALKQSKEAGPVFCPPLAIEY